MPSTGNASYIGTYDGSTYAYSALAIELSVARKFVDAFFSSQPLLSMIRTNKTNFQKGSVEGTALLIPILMDNVVTNPAAGVLDSAELTQPTAEVMRGLTQAKYEIAHYRMPLWKRESERRLAQKPATATRGDLEQGRYLQLQNSFLTTINTHLMSANAGARDRVQGVRHVLATGNTVGGISQTTDSWWRAQVLTSAGAFDLDIIADMYDATNTKQQGYIDNQRADLMMASYSASNNVYGKFRAAIQESVQLSNPEFTAKYGFTAMFYLDCAVVQDPAGTAGEVLILNTSTWHYYGDETPYLAKAAPWPGTDADWETWTMFCAVGCNNPGRNARIAGLT